MSRSIVVARQTRERGEEFRRQHSARRDCHAISPLAPPRRCGLRDRAESTWIVDAGLDNRVRDSFRKVIPATDSMGV